MVTRGGEVVERWEYFVKTWDGAIVANDDLELQNMLNSYGFEGWELVNIIPQVGGSHGEVTVDFNQLIFKRIKE